jgi:hypothetical protein
LPIVCKVAKPSQKKRPKEKTGNPIEISSNVFAWHSLPSSRSTVFGIEKQRFRFLNAFIFDVLSKIIRINQEKY